MSIENPPWWLARNLCHKSQLSPAGDYNSASLETRCGYLCKCYQGDLKGASSALSFK